MQRQIQTESPYLRKVEYVFYKEAQIREAVAEVRGKIIRAEIRNDSHIGDPTAAAAIRDLTPVDAIFIDNQILRQPESWLEVVNATKTWCRGKGAVYERVLSGRYSGEYFQKTCGELGITQDNYYRTLDKIRNYAAMWAAWFHLVAF